MKAIGQISILHLILLIMTCIGLKNHVTILPPLLSEVKRDGWISVLLSMLIILPWIFIIVYIQKQTNSRPINVWLRERIGKIPSAIVLYSSVIFIYFLAAFSMRETILWISTTFLNNTPQLLLLIVYVIVCFLLSSTNIQTIVITNAFVLFFIVIFGYYVALVNMKVKDYSLLLPMFEHGYTPIFQGMVYPASGFIELIFIVYLQHHLKRQLKWKHLFIIILILAGLTLGPLTGAIAEFGPTEAAKQKYPAYEEWGLVTLGEFIDHLDFLSIHQWLAGTFIRVGTLMFIVADILNINGKPKKIWFWLMPPFLFLNLILFLLDDTFFLRLNNHEFLIFSVIYLFILSIILLLAVMKGKKNDNMNQHESGMNNGPQQGSINITINQWSGQQPNQSAQPNNGQPNNSKEQSANGQANSGSQQQSAGGHNPSTSSANEPINITINQPGGDSKNGANGSNESHNPSQQSNNESSQFNAQSSNQSGSQQSSNGANQSTNGANQQLNKSGASSNNQSNGPSNESNQSNNAQSVHNPSEQSGQQSSNNSQQSNNNESSQSNNQQPSNEPINITINQPGSDPNNGSQQPNNNSSNQSGNESTTIIINESNDKSNNS